MDGRTKFFRLVDEHNLQHVRQGKHPILQLPDGTTLPYPGSPGCSRSWDNMYSQLRARLGLRPEHHDGERREKKLKRRVDPETQPWNLHGVQSGRWPSDRPNQANTPKSFSDKLREVWG